MAEAISQNQAALSWEVTRLAGSLGAEVRGVDLASVSEAEFEQLQTLLLEHLVLFFPGQDVTMAQHVALGRRFGDLEGHPHLENPYPEFPEVFQLVASGGGVADEWHSDITFSPSPSKMSILRMAKCPEFGGDTMWSSLYAAYDGLSEPMRAMCDGLTALHDATPHNQPDKMTTHPVVRIHPVTGRKALYVNEHFTRRIVELNATESDLLLGYLCDWVQKPRFTVRYHWSEETLCMWDNRCTQHFVLNDFEGERIIQRVTVMGDEVEGCGAPGWKPWVRDGRLSATSRHDRKLFMHLQESGQLP